MQDKNRLDNPRVLLLLYHSRPDTTAREVDPPSPVAVFYAFGAISTSFRSPFFSLASFPATPTTFSFLLFLFVIVVLLMLPFVVWCVCVCVCLASCCCVGESISSYALKVKSSINLTTMKDERHAKSKPHNLLVSLHPFRLSGTSGSRVVLW